MIDERKRLICDCCGRQIVEGCRSDKWTTPTSGCDIHLIDINAHCCRECWPSYKEWEDIEKAKFNNLGY